jgi:hypothetical protein
MPDDEVWTAFHSELGTVAGGDAAPDPAAATDVTEAVLDAGIAVLTAARSLLDLAERRLEARREPEEDAAATHLPARRRQLRRKPDERRQQAIDLSY